MVSAMLDLESELEYQVSYRRLELPQANREVTSKDRFHSEARYSRSGKRLGPSTAAHRRNSKLN